jgi:hypothetical protein
MDESTTHFSYYSICDWQSNMNVQNAISNVKERNYYQFLMKFWNSSVYEFCELCQLFVWNLEI